MDQVANIPDTWRERAYSRWRYHTFDLRDRDRRCAENLTIWVVWHIPTELVRWCIIRAWAHSTQGEWGNEEVTSVTVEQMLGRWGKPNDG